jgi:AcrR family transcriptional regulator
MKSESKKRAAPTAADDAALLGDDESESPLVRSRSQRALSRGDTRRALVWCGTELLTERGFQVTGIDEVLKRVGVPKGSFYHFFASKHAFGEAVIQNYVEYYAARWIASSTTRHARRWRACTTSSKTRSAAWPSTASVAAA